MTLQSSCPRLWSSRVTGRYHQALAQHAYLLTVKIGQIHSLAGLSSLIDNMFFLIRLQVCAIIYLICAPPTDRKLQEGTVWSTVSMKTYSGSSVESA